MPEPDWGPGGSPYGPPPRRRRSRAKGCLGVGCLVILLALVLAVVLAVVGGSKLTVKTGGRQAPAVAATAGPSA
jgi:hypothetical protein